MTKIDQQLIDKELIRSKSALKAAQKLLEEELYEDAISRAYYACLHSAKAVLLEQGVVISSHKAAVVLFGKHLVLLGKIEKEYGRIFHQLRADRDIGDYDVLQTIDVSRAQQRVNDAAKFIKRMQQLLKSQCIKRSKKND